MIPLPKDITVGDVRQWLGDGVCLFKHPESGDPVPGTYHDCEWNNSEIVRRIVLCGVSDGNLHVVSPEDVYVYWPKFGAVNITQTDSDLPHPVFALYVQRDQVRRYCRTFNRRGFTVVVPGEDMVRRRVSPGTIANASATPNLALSLHSPNYYAVPEALAALGTGAAVSVALSRSVVLAQQALGELLVYYRGRLVAKRIDGVLVSLIGPRLPKAITKRLEG